MNILASVVLIASLLENVVLGVGVEKCFQRDSISCLQLEVLNSARFLLDKKAINVGDFVNITTKQEQRTAKALKDLENRVLKSKDLSERQIALEEYLEKQVKIWWEGLSVSWNFKKIMGALTVFFPEESQPQTSAGEARGKEKKQPDGTIPLLIAIKLKTLAAVAYMAITVLAKKAILAGVISMLVSGFIALKNLSGTPKFHSGLYNTGWQSQMTPHHNPTWRDSEASPFQKTGDFLAGGNSPQVTKF